MACLITRKVVLRHLLLVYFTNLTLVKAEILKFTNNIADNHFSDCYIMKISKTASTGFRDTILSTPYISINIEESGYTKVIQHFTEQKRRTLTTKHNDQCILFYMSLIDFTYSDMENLLKIFKTPVVQVSATFAYLLIAEFSNYNTAETFIQSLQLKNFQHRILVENQKVDSTAETNKRVTKASRVSLTLKRFCYFCTEGGNPGFVAENKIYGINDDLNNLNEIFPDVTKNFNGKTLRVTAPPAPPLVLITRSKTNPGKNEIQGQHAHILYSLANHFNFTYTLYSSPGGLTGIKLSNGTWNGIMGEILYDRADIGLSVATSFERYQIVDVTVSVFYAFLVLVSTKPKPVFEWQAIFYPFRLNCWLAFVASTIFTFYASKWLHNNAIKYEIPALLKGESQAKILAKLKGEFMTSYKSFYLTVGQLLEQGTPFDFDTIPSRMYSIFWMFFAIIITTAYRSKLFTFLTFPTVEIPPSTFLELAKSTYKFGMKHLGGIAFVFITKSPLPYIRNVGEKMTVYNDKYSCLDRTFTDRFTCIIYKAYIDYMTEVRYWKIRHNFHVSDFVTPPVGSSWVLPKRAPWLPEFNRVSYPVYEMGLADKYLRDYQVKIAKFLRAQAQASNSSQDIFEINSNYKGDDEGGPKPLVMANMYAAFVILIVGIIVSAILFFLEVIRKIKLRKKNRERRKKLRLHITRMAEQRKRELPTSVETSNTSDQALQNVVSVILGLTRQRRSRFLNTSTSRIEVVQGRNLPTISLPTVNV